MMPDNFSIPEGWKLDGSTLIGPEGDLSIGFVELEFADDARKIALAAWKRAEPAFDSKVLRDVAMPPQGGWDAMHQIVYEVPAKESRIELAVVRRLGSRAFVNIVRGSTAAFSRRGAQLNEAILSWKPEGYEEEDLKNAAASPWTDEIARQLREFVLHGMAVMHVPGVSIAVVRGGKVVFAEGLGVRSLSDRAPVTPRTRFMIGSSTKPLTTLLMAKLIDQKKLSWLTPVVDLLMDFSLADPEVTERLQLRHTASASTGMPRQDVEFLFRYSGLTAEDRMAQMKAMRPTTGFGETFQYSNLLVAAGGFAAARAYAPNGPLSEAFQQALTELVFHPLQMNDSFLRPEDALAAEAALPHAMSFEGQATGIAVNLEAFYSVAPAGAVWSTALDMAKYVSLELAKGRLPSGEQFISEEILLERRNKGVKIDEHSSYGLGLFVTDSSGLLVIHHGGNTRGYSADMFFLPERDLGVVVLTNVYAANMFLVAVRQKLFELLFGAEPKSGKALDSTARARRDGMELLRKKTTVDPESMSWVHELVGRYHCPELGPAEILLRDDGFWVQFQEWDSRLGSEIQPSGDRLLRLLNPPWSGAIKMLVDSGGEKISIDGGQRKYVFSRQR